MSLLWQIEVILPRCRIYHDVFHEISRTMTMHFPKKAIGQRVPLVAGTRAKQFTMGSKRR